MLKLRNIPNFLCVVVPALTWVACGSDSGDDSSSAGTGGVSRQGRVQRRKGGGGSTGKAGASGSTAGSGALAGAPEAGEGGEGGSSGEAGAPAQGGSGATGGTAGGAGAPADPLATDVDTIVFIYAENRSFDGLYGNFPGAHGLSEVLDNTGAPTGAYVPQKDRDGTTVLTKLPKTWTGATAPGNPTVITPEAMTDGLANKPFPLETGFVAGGGSPLSTADVTRDMAHRFFENIMEINGGTNDMFAAFLDAGGITMGHFDYSASKMYKLAQDYVLADNFFQAAYGGSLLESPVLDLLVRAELAGVVGRQQLAGAQRARDGKLEGRAAARPQRRLAGFRDRRRDQPQDRQRRAARLLRNW